MTVFDLVSKKNNMEHDINSALFLPTHLVGHSSLHFSFTRIGSIGCPIFHKIKQHAQGDAGSW